jgi:HAD superfamily hydrolase (TIGR01662 family)
MADPSLVRAILFDADNTLYDYKGGQLSACEAVIAYTGVGNAKNLNSYFLLNPFHCENGLIITYYLHDIGIFDDEIVYDAGAIYEKIKCEKTICFDGVYETLQELRDRKIPLGIVSNARSRDLCSCLEKNGIREFFQVIVTPDEIDAKKPSLRPFERALSLLSAEPERSLMIGDTMANDLIPAKKLGMQTIFFNSEGGNGPSSPSGSQDVDYIISQFNCIPYILDRSPLLEIPGFTGNQKKLPTDLKKS